MKAALRYPGSKWNIAGWIVDHLPAHDHYIEPFFGSGAVLFNKARSRHELVNDISGDVVTTFRVIRDRGIELAAAIEMTPWSRDEYQLAYAPCDCDLERARRFLVRTWQAHSAATDHCTGWTSQGTTLSYVTPTEKWLRLPDRIRAVIERLRGVEIDNRPAIDVIRRHAGPDVLLYCDPPYMHETRNSRAYAHEMSAADHQELLDALASHPGPVILSGYHCPLYDAYLARWAAKEKRTRADVGFRTEVLWLNPVCVERLGYGPLFEV